MQHLEVSGAVRLIFIYVVRQQMVKQSVHFTFTFTMGASPPSRLILGDRSHPNSTLSVPLVPSD